MLLKNNFLIYFYDKMSPFLENPIKRSTRFVLVKYLKTDIKLSNKLTLKKLGLLKTSYLHSLGNNTIYDWVKF